MIDSQLLSRSIANMDINFDSNEEQMTNEMEKQRRKLRDIGHTLDQQHQLLRLIIQVTLDAISIRIKSHSQLFHPQKMEIKSEADDVDEGVSPSELRPISANAVNISTMRWTSPRIRKKLKHLKSFTKNT